MRSSFASFLLTQKKRRLPAGKCGGRRGEAVKAGEGFSPGKAPSRTLPKSVYGKRHYVGKETADMR